MLCLPEFKAAIEGSDIKLEWGDGCFAPYLDLQIFWELTEAGECPRGLIHDKPPDQEMASSGLIGTSLANRVLKREDE